jgi:hypothetical protein
LRCIELILIVGQRGVHRNFDRPFGEALLMVPVTGLARGGALGLRGLPGRGLGRPFLLGLAAVFLEFGVQHQRQAQCLADVGIGLAEIGPGRILTGRDIGADLLQHRDGRFGRPLQQAQAPLAELAGLAFLKGGWDRTGRW